MDTAALQMNCDKAEFITFGSRVQLSKTSVKSVIVSNIYVQKAECIRFLGTWLVKSLNFLKHIKVNCKL